MEIVGGDGGSKLRLKLSKPKELGRELGFSSTDPTVSRRHVRFHLLNSPRKYKIRVQFQVIGKNPIWVHYRKAGDINIYRHFESGEMECGDMFCISATKPFWFTLKRLELDDDEHIELGLQSDLDESGDLEELDFDAIDILDIDHVREFGFVVMGHEFDSYPKKMIRPVKDWDWFIDEPGEDESENDEDGEKKRKGGERRKRKKGGGGEYDDEWIGESEDEVLAKSSKVKRPKYVTRSKGSDRPVKDVKTIVNPPQIINEEDDDDDEDETLEGFIVDEYSAGEEQENDDEEEFDEEDSEEE